MYMYIYIHICIDMHNLYMYKIIHIIDMVRNTWCERRTNLSRRRDPRLGAEVSRLHGLHLSMSLQGHLAGTCNGDSKQQRCDVKNMSLMMVNDD